MRAPLAAALGAALLSTGCPIPQALPDYPAGTVTPPRIVVDQISRSETVLSVPAGCVLAPTFVLDATLIDANTLEAVSARWFVNYDPADSARYGPVQQSDIQGVDATPPVTQRTVPPYTFHPYDSFPTIAGTGSGSGTVAGAVHLVELVVSNGFDPALTAPPAALPYRTPLPGFETQVYRWLFVTVPESTGCTAGEPGCVKCPTP